MSTSRMFSTLSLLGVAACVQRPPAGGGQSGEEWDESAYQPCVEGSRTPVAAGAVAPNGVAIDDVVAAVNSSATLPLVWADGSATSVQLTLGTSASGVWVDMVPNPGAAGDTGPSPAIYTEDTGGGELCADWLELDLSVGFVTADGAFAENRSGVLQVESDGVGRFDLTVPAATLTGAWSATAARDGFDAADWDEVTLFFRGEKGLGDATGVVEAQASRVDGDGPEGTASAAMFTVATFGSAAR